MSTIQGTSGAQGARWFSDNSAPKAEAGPGGGPVLPADAELYGVGLDLVAASLVSKAAESTIKLARESQRAAKLEQVAEQRRQAECLHEKAGETRLQAWVSGSASIGGGIASFSSGASLTTANKETGTSKMLGALGGTASSLSQPLGTLSGGARATELEADSSTHGARAKTAEGVVEEYASLERQARTILEKASSVMQSLVQERQAITRAALRGA